MNLKNIVTLGVATFAIYEALNVGVQTSKFAVKGMLIGKLYDSNWVPEAKDMVYETYDKYKNSWFKVALYARGYKYGFDHYKDILG